MVEDRWRCCNHTLHIPTPVGQYAVAEYLSFHRVRVLNSAEIQLHVRVFYDTIIACNSFCILGGEMPVLSGLGGLEFTITGLFTRYMTEVMSSSRDNNHETTNGLLPKAANRLAGW